MLMRTNPHQFYGIGETPVETKKEVKFELGDREHILAVVSDDFPIEKDGILGMPFLDSEEAKINFKKRTIVLTKTIHRVFNMQMSEDRLHNLEKNVRLQHVSDPEERNKLWELIEQFGDIFTLPDDALPATTLVKHSIPTTDEIPVHVKQYRYPQVHQAEISRQVNEMREKEIVRNTSCPYNSPICVVPKKEDACGKKKWRIVINFRGLNAKTLHDAYSLPNINEILDRLGSAKYFSAFDLASGFHQIKMDLQDQQKTAFSTPDGHYEYLRMSFGLKNAPATFQRMMNQALRG